VTKSSLASRRCWWRRASLLLDTVESTVLGRMDVEPPALSRPEDG
jgi:hypothetical protein